MLLLDKRRKIQDRNNSEYKKINKEIMKKCWEDKCRWFAKKMQVFRRIRKRKQNA